MNRKLPTLTSFQQVFFATIFFTLISGGGAMLLATQTQLSSQQTRIFENLNTTWNMGIGAIFGLLGSKATELLGESDDDENESNH